MVAVEWIEFYCLIFGCIITGHEAFQQPANRSRQNTDWDQRVISVKSAVNAPVSGLPRPQGIIPGRLVEK